MPIRTLWPGIKPVLEEQIPEVKEVVANQGWLQGEIKMERQGKDFVCHSCGKTVECPPGELPCEVLKDWITVAQWKGHGEVTHYNFCSFSCLKSWGEKQIPSVPEVFLKSFEDDHEGK